MTETLEPCPFCGGKVEIYDGAPHYASAVACPACDCTLYGTTTAEAIAAWSRRAPVTVSEAAGVQDAESIPDYDAGLLNDFGGGNVDWWLDYIRSEIGRANDHWRDALRALAGRNG